MGVRVGIDTGGTFTDLVSFDGKAFRVEKVPSTPRNPSASTLDVLKKAELGGCCEIEELVQGTTVATNAIIERRGPVVGLLTTAGFRDVLPAQRVTRPRAFDLQWVKPQHLVPRYLILEVNERVDSRGTVVEPVDEEEVRKAVAALRQEGVTALAISFLFAYLNAENERRAQAIVMQEAPDMAVSISSGVFGQWREYERSSTCVVDAFLKPVVSTYAVALEEISQEHGARLLLMRSNGGVMTPESARRQPVALVRSGPAGGVTAAIRIGEVTGEPNLILADMGGTSFDTCLIHRSEPSLTTQAEIEWGVTIGIPMVDVRSIGAGGGSIAWLDSANMLRVGPHSAGADPGPACYSLGGQNPTLTDANLVLGRLGEEHPLAGDVRLDRSLAEAAISRLALPMGRSIEEVALGIVDIADSHMAQALRLVSIDRGFDPRDFSMVAFGGAGPLHASSLARSLSIRRVVVPVFPGAFSAYGALIANTRFDYMRTSISRGSDEDAAMIREVFQELADQAKGDLQQEGIEEEPTITRSVDIRYSGQNWEIEVPINGELDLGSLSDLRQRFHERHAKQFGWNLPDGELEFVNLRLVATVVHPRPAPPRVPDGPVPEPLSLRSVIFRDPSNPVKTPIYWRDDLRAGNNLSGPAIVAEMDSTVLLAPGDSAQVDEHGNIMVTVGRD